MPELGAARDPAGSRLRTRPLVATIATIAIIDNNIVANDYSYDYYSSYYSYDLLAITAVSRLRTPLAKPDSQPSGPRTRGNLLPSESQSGTPHLGNASGTSDAWIRKPRRCGDGFRKRACAPLVSSAVGPGVAARQPVFASPRHEQIIARARAEGRQGRVAFGGRRGGAGERGVAEPAACEDSSKPWRGRPTSTRGWSPPPLRGPPGKETGPQSMWAVGTARRSALGSESLHSFCAMPGAAAVHVREGLRSRAPMVANRTCRALDGECTRLGLGVL